MTKDHPRCIICPLRQQPAFRSCTEEELNTIQDFRQNVINCPEDTDLIREGHRTALYTILSGWAFRYKTLSDGRRQILNFLMPGDLIGLQEQVFEVSPHGVKTLTEMTACEFSQNKLWHLFEEHPSLAYDITWMAAHEESMVDENLLSVGRRTIIG